jgi:hypothetical protein
MAGINYTDEREYLPKLKFRSKETEKQIEFIKYIESEIGIYYNGKSKEDAIIFISENKNKINNENMWSIINGY